MIFPPAAGPPQRLHFRMGGDILSGQSFVVPFGDHLARRRVMTAPTGTSPAAAACVANANARRIIARSISEKSTTLLDIALMIILRFPKIGSRRNFGRYR